MLLEISGEIPPEKSVEKYLQYWEYLENTMNIMKRQKDRKLKVELPRLVVVQYATGNQWRNTSRKMKDWNQSKSNTQL